MARLTIGSWVRSMIVAGARSEHPSRIGRSDALHWLRQSALAVILAFYFFTLAASIAWVLEVVCRQLCSVLTESCGETGGSILCVLSVLVLCSLGSVFFVIFGFASVPLLGCVVAVLGPPVLALGFLSSYGLQLGLCYAALVMGAVMIVLLWASYAFGGLCRCIGLHRDDEDHLHWLLASARRESEVDVLVERLCESCVIEGRELLRKGKVAEADVEEMSSSIIIGLPAVTIFWQLLRSSTTPPGGLLGGGGGGGAISASPAAGPLSPLLLETGSTAAFLDPVAAGLAQVYARVLRRLRALRLQQDEAECVSEWLLGQERLQPFACERRSREIGAVVADLTGLSIDITRTDAFKRHSFRMFNDILGMDLAA